MSPSLELFQKRLPGGSLVAAIIAFSMGIAHLHEYRRLSAITIAKTHHREMLELLLLHVDLVESGNSRDKYESLRRDEDRFRRYRWLFAIALFSLQKLYVTFVLIKPRDKVWAQTILIIASVFKPHLMSEESFPRVIREGYRKGFLDYVQSGLKGLNMRSVDSGTPMLTAARDRGRAGPGRPGCSQGRLRISANVTGHFGPS